MDAYHIALFLHIVALVLAAGATTITKLAAERRARARTVAEAIEWHSRLESSSKLFPIALVVFVLTGGYMLSLGQSGLWTSGFVVAGLAGVLLLFASGTFLRIKGQALAKVLENIAKNGVDHPAPKLVPPPLVRALPEINTALALAIVFDMVTKPTDIVVALGVLVLGIVLGAGLALRSKPAAAARDASQAEAA